jgi:predicted DNA-binding transcriptional regulator YafY
MHMVRKTLALALENGKPVRIVYDSGKALTERTVDVVSLDGDRFTAFCRLRKRRRTFKLDGVLSAVLLDSGP